MAPPLITAGPILCSDFWARSNLDPEKEFKNRDYDKINSINNKFIPIISSMNNVYNYLMIPERHEQYEQSSQRKGQQ